MIDYTVVEGNSFYMTHEARQRATETHCDGCGKDLETRWPHGRILTVLTDRSGSEQASGHGECIDLMIENVEDPDLEDFSEIYDNYDPDAERERIREITGRKL